MIIMRHNDDDHENYMTKKMVESVTLIDDNVIIVQIGLFMGTRVMMIVRT